MWKMYLNKNYTFEYCKIKNEKLLRERNVFFDEVVFLKTIFPSKKFTKKYLKEI